MSIFKESFKDFVRKQIKIREAIISHGNSAEESRTNSPKVDLTNLGGPKDLVLPSHAFYTNTTNRQCTIRMSSGVDLKSNNELIKDNSNPFERKDDLVNEGLALRYILEGGIPMVDRTVEQTSVETEGNKTTTTSKARIRQAARSGFTGASKNRFGQTYGDPTIRANSADGYGIVPMPGITDANIRTASAYGSLREAQVNFVCHNIKQLEILEILYMRPGYPVLLEWGWTPFIDNTGERRSDFSYINEWWNQNSSLEEINKLVIERKIETGGNYDGLVGLVKNFNYTARPDGGFNCTTELTGVGETIEALKGRSDIYDTEEGRFTTAFEQFMKNLLAFSKYADRNVIDADEKLDGVLGRVQSSYNWLRKKTLSAAEKYGFYEAPTSVYDYLGFGWLADHKNYPSVYDGLEEAYGGDQDAKNEKRQKILENFMLRHDQSLVAQYDDEGELTENIKSNSTYIRLDFFCHVMNQHILERNENGDSPIVYLKTDTLVHEDREVIVKEDGSISTDGRHIQPLTYCTSTISENLKNEFKTLYNRAIDEDRTNGWFGIGDKEFEEFYGKGGSDINNALSDIEKLFKDSDVTKYIKSFSVLMESDRLDMSIDPTICLLPHQMKFLNDKNNRNKDTQDAFYRRVQPQFAYNGIGNPKSNSKGTKYDEFIQLCNYDIQKEKPGIFDRQIGHIYLNVEHLLRTFQSMRYDIDLSRGTEDAVRSNLDFNIFDFFKQILKDINDACGGQHKFTLQTDNERPNCLKIVDLIFQPEENINLEIKEGKVVELNIQSNDSIFRDLQYTSTVPSSLMTTIGVVAQNPDAVSDLEQSTFSALNVNVRQRFAQKPKSVEKPRVLKGADKKEADRIAEEKKEAAQQELFAERTAFDISLLDTFKAYVSLKVFYQGVIRGEFTKTDSDGKPKHSDEIGKQKQNLKTIINEVNKISKRHLKDGKYANGDDFKRGEVKRAPDQGVSDIIPLKFQAVVDGIGGIVIGSTFKINPSRLPMVYRKTQGRQILFICMTEEQNITAGQDWTTSISGQLTIIGDDPSTQDTGGKKGKGDGSGGTVGTNASGAAGDGDSGGGESQNKIESEVEPTRENDLPNDEPETKTQEEEQLDKQDECPEGFYFDEERGGCYENDPEPEPEPEENTDKVNELFVQWKDNLAKHFIAVDQMRALSENLATNNAKVFASKSNEQAVVSYYAWHETARKRTQNVKNLANNSGNPEGLIAKLMEEGASYKLPNKKGGYNTFTTEEQMGPRAREIHNIDDTKFHESLFDSFINFTSVATDYLKRAKTGATYVKDSANEQALLKNKDFYGFDPSNTTYEVDIENIVETYRGFEIKTIANLYYPDKDGYSARTNRLNIYGLTDEVVDYWVYESAYRNEPDIQLIRDQIDIGIEDWEDDTGKIYTGENDRVT